MTMPNFLLLGANKAGTTALAAALGQHPSIYISPVKEPTFFCRVGRNEPDVVELGAPSGKSKQTKLYSKLEDYRRLFDEVNGETAIGEASTAYLANPRCAEVIREYIPDVKLIAVLRNPAERAFSNYLMYRQRGVEPVRDFRRVLELQERRIAEGYPQGWHYVQLGYYAGAIRTFQEVFGASRLLVHLYEDWSNDPRRILRETFGFLGVDESDTPDTSAKRNVSKVARNGVIDYLIHRSNPLKAGARLLVPDALRKAAVQKLEDWNKPKLAPRDRRDLIDLYRDDILELQGLIGRDLSCWLA